MYAAPEKIVFQEIMSCWKADPILTVSDWADQKRVLSRKASSEPGQWRTSRTPYLKEIMDCLSVTDPCKKVVFKKSSQVGGTECGNNWIGYIMDYVPAPTMIVMPNLDLARKNSRVRIQPLIEECESILKKMPNTKMKEKGNTLLEKEFPGGSLTMIGAASTTGLKSLPIRFLMLDEVDEYDIDINNQGDAISLGLARQRTFSRRKAFILSTPTIQGQSRIDIEFEKSDQRHYHVPCPHCNEKQKLIFENLRWDGDDHKTAAYYCEHCGEEIKEHNKTFMLENGEWIAENPESETPGFFINSLYSPVGWFSWSEIAKDFLESKGDREKMKTFTNTLLGLSWEEKGEVPEWKIIYMRREDYDLGHVPKAALFLTMAVDVQKDRLEWEVKGWGRKKENWSIDFGVIEGTTNSDEVWEALDYQMAQTYKREDGIEVPIKKIVIDSGYETQKVYTFCSDYHPKRVIPLKGRDELQAVLSTPRGVHIRSNGKIVKKNAVMLWGYGASIIKSEVYGWLKKNFIPENGVTPIGFSHFPMYDEEYFKQLTAEQLIKQKDAMGFYKYKWKKLRERNEALDLFVMNRVAAAIEGMDRFGEKDWAKLENQPTVAKPLKKSQNKSTPRKNRKKQKGSFW